MKKFRLFENASNIDIEKVYRPSIYNINGRISLDEHIALCGWLAYEGEEATPFYAQKFGQYWVVLRQWSDDNNIGIYIVNHGDMLENSNCSNHKETFLNIAEQYIIDAAFRSDKLESEAHNITDKIMKTLDYIDIPMFDVFEKVIDANWLDWNIDSDKAIKVLFS